jgi:hypothetical protein
VKESIQHSAVSHQPAERIGSEEASRRDTELFQQAAREKGGDASFSDIASHAQTLKLKVGLEPAERLRPAEPPFTQKELR